jgi:hypothetical protein
MSQLTYVLLSQTKLLALSSGFQTVVREPLGRKKKFRDDRRIKYVNTDKFVIIFTE